MLSESAVSVQVHEKAVIATIECAELDNVSTQRLKSEMKTVFDGNGALSVLLDLSKVSFVASVALGAFVEMHQTMLKANRKFILVGMRPQIESVFRMAALDSYFESCADAQEALGRLKSEPA